MCITSTEPNPNRSGLGRCLTLEALKRGDKVIATGRSQSFSKLEDLKAQGADTLELDVTAPPETLEEVAKRAIQIYGRIDVLVHNAGQDFLTVHGVIMILTENVTRLRGTWSVGREGVSPPRMGIPESFTHFDF